MQNVHWLFFSVLFSHFRIARIGRFRELDSKVTDAVIEQVVEWQSRPLDTVYPIIIESGDRLDGHF
ncbi:hypothetical protein E0M66_20900 [Escherichia coli]|nr:hypothetical protein [Escherichia coli]